MSQVECVFFDCDGTLVEDSVAGAQAGITAGIPVFYYCADPHNPPLDHPLVTTFHDMHELPAIWR